MRRSPTALFLLAALLLGSCEDSSKVSPRLTNAEDPTADKPTQISYNTSMNFSSGGLMRAILHAGRIQNFEAKRYTYLDSNVKVDFFDRNGKHSSTLTSRSARVSSENNMTAYGKVHIVSDSGTVVDTDSLEWKNKEQTLHSDAPVRIAEKNGRVTTGIGFESDQSLTHYSIMHPTIQAPPEVMQNGSGPATPTIRPQQPVIPGAGAISGQPFGTQRLPADTVRK